MTLTYLKEYRLNLITSVDVLCDVCGRKQADRNYAY
jgi:hypothetical protein